MNVNGTTLITHPTIPFEKERVAPVLREIYNNEIDDYSRGLCAWFYDNGASSTLRYGHLETVTFSFIDQGLHCILLFTTYSLHK